jgi:hypothetical protein
MRRKAKRRPPVSTDETQVGDATRGTAGRPMAPKMDGPGGAPGGAPQHWKKVEKPAPDNAEPSFDDSVDDIGR